MRDDYWYQRYYIPGQKEWVRSGRIKAFLLGYVIAAFIFTGLGYAWRMAQVEEEYHERIAKITAKYLDARDRIADLEARLGIKKGKGRKYE